MMRGAGPIVDDEILTTIKNLPFSNFFCDTDYKSIDTKILSSYLNFLPEWIASSELNDVIGLEQFPFKRLTSGITQSFDDFFICHNQRTFKFFPGEYPYLRRFIKNWAFCDKLTKEDALIISAPFSATGEMHPEFYKTLEIATDIGIPVLVDCAFFGICKNLNLYLDYPCIESVCFSLSKAFGSGCFRSGIEFSKREGGSVATQNKWCYVQLLSAKIGLELAKIFPPDYIYKKYRPIQEDICKTFDLKPSNTVIFGIGGENFKYFDIDGIVNRCCITPSIKSYVK